MYLMYFNIIKLVGLNSRINIYALCSLNTLGFLQHAGFLQQYPQLNIKYCSRTVVNHEGEYTAESIVLHLSISVTSCFFRQHNTDND